MPPLLQAHATRAARSAQDRVLHSSDTQPWPPSPFSPPEACRTYSQGSGPGSAAYSSSNDPRHLQGRQQVSGWSTVSLKTQQRVKALLPRRPLSLSPAPITAFSPLDAPISPLILHLQRGPAIH
ncbi:hypothetical protein NDU88_003769 [Pleurodeles waltl]|uniref:Uncharacterized protein n=1 Tax=Pleurodeles waltl TaxID=8319 RepID=A0AAV7MWJ8_PLEWA|nr:hypothetical protein NDU88_003769 [Pleurodeles waltl]